MGTRFVAELGKHSIELPATFSFRGHISGSGTTKNAVHPDVDLIFMCCTSEIPFYGQRIVLLYRNVAGESTVVVQLRVVLAERGTRLAMDGYLGCAIRCWLRALHVGN